jgi:hypothetical protein
MGKQGQYNKIINRTGAPEAILEKVSTEVFLHVAAGYLYRWVPEHHDTKTYIHFHSVIRNIGNI